MCQLTYMNLPKSFLHVGLSLQLVTNASRNNHDGWGIFTEQTGVLKSAESANYKLGSILSDKNLSTPAIGHVRLKSAAYKVLPADVANSHPFEKKNIILAHNGTLSSEVFTDETKIDSEIFADALDTHLETTKESVEIALPKLMENFTGKFAFMIYDKRNKSWYASRGNTADLYIAHISLNDRPYYIVNTEKDSLDNWCAQFFLIAGALGNKIHLVKNIFLLERESIFKLTREEPKKVGEVKENYPKVTHVPVTYPAGTNYSTWKGGRNLADSDDAGFLGMGKLGILNGVNFKEIDELFFLCIGKSILICDEAEIKNAMNLIIEIIRPHLTAQKLQLVQNIREKGTVSEAVKLLPKVPIILNTPEDLKEARKQMYKAHHADLEE
jgi:predicted glutamine amidotransferase